MAIISVMTADGENLRAQNIANGSTSQIDRIEAAMGHVATAALARALSDVVTPFVPVRQINNPQGRALASDPVAQFRYQDGAQVDYNIVEFGVFAGTVMTHYICDDAGGTIYPKTASLLLDVVLHITATSGDQATFTFDADLTAPVATTGTPGLVRLATDVEAQATGANASDQRVPTLSKLWTWWNTVRPGIIALIAAAATPAGGIVAYGGAAAPSGYLLCDGRAVSRATYSGLFAAIGTTWGGGNGATTFNLPDLRSRVLAGAGAGLGAGLDSVGETGGEATHTLTVEEMPAHSHEETRLTDPPPSDQNQPSQGTNAGYTTLDTSETGGGQSHNNVQPTAVVNWVIKT